MGLNGIELIKQERERQIYEEGWTAEHDDEHINNELALAAVCYADPYQHFNLGDLTKIIPNEDFWPSTWDSSWFKPTTRIRDLAKSGALIAAEIDRLKRIEIKQYKEKLIPHIKKMVDNAFKKFGEDGDNIIILSACYYPDRSTVELEEPLQQINFSKEYEREKKLHFPIGRNWKLGSWSQKGPDINKLDDLQDNYVSPICKLLDKCDIEWFSEEYYKDNNDALNEYWCGCIGIMKDYKIVSFVIRDDGLLCSENSINGGYNKIIEQL